jgi:hypothetical protein
MNLLFTQYENNQILNPFTSLIRLCLLPYIDSGTKLCISNSRIYYQYPSFLQGLIRWKNGDKHYDLHNLYSSIVKSTEWYNMEHNSINNIFKMTIIGLEQLKQSYQNTLLIQHSMAHYIDIINNHLKDIDIKSVDEVFTDIEDLTDLEQNLKGIWGENEINVIYNLLSLLSYEDKVSPNNKCIVSAINIILDGKDCETYRIITTHSTLL